MSDKELKKMIVFSNLRKRTIIESILSDEAIIKNRSISSLMEEHILNDILPFNTDASGWVEYLYDGTTGIQGTLSTIFQELSCGRNWEAKHDNAIDVVKFAHHWECLAHNSPNTNAPEMPHFISQLDSVVQKLQEAADNEIEHIYEMSKEVVWAKDLLHLAQKSPEYLRYSNVYQLVINNWDLLKNWSITYRLLADLVLMQTKWPESAEARYELTQLIIRMSSEWN